MNSIIVSDKPQLRIMHLNEGFGQKESPGDLHLMRVIETIEEKKGRFD